MNTAHTPQALRLPHRQIAEASARRQAEHDAFESAAARLRPAWVQTREPRPAHAVTPVGPPATPLVKALRKEATTRLHAEAEHYRRRLLGELDRSQRNLRRWFVVGFVAACAVLALSEASAPAQAHPQAPLGSVASEVTPARPVQAAVERAAR